MLWKVYKCFQSIHVFWKNSLTLLKFSGCSGKILDTLESFWTLRKRFRHSLKFLDTLKCSRYSDALNFLRTLESLRQSTNLIKLLRISRPSEKNFTLWSVFRSSEKFFTPCLFTKHSEKLRQCCLWWSNKKYIHTILTQSKYNCLNCYFIIMQFLELKKWHFLKDLGNFDRFYTGRRGAQCALTPVSLLILNTWLYVG